MTQFRSMTIDLAGADDAEVFSRTIAEDRVLVTENFADYSVLLNDRLRADEPCVPVVFVHKPDFPTGGALAVQLADHMHTWALRTPTPTSGLIGRSRGGAGGPSIFLLYQASGMGFMSGAPAVLFYRGPIETA